MKTKDLSKVALLKRIKLQNTFGKKIKTSNVFKNKKK